MGAFTAIPKGRGCCFSIHHSVFPFGSGRPENIERSPRGNKKSYLIYMNYGWIPEAAEFVERLSFLKLIYRGETTLIFEFVP
jgi:hypothetical protein